MNYFSDLFDKVVYMFRTGPLSIIRSISTLYTCNRYLSCQLCWLSASVVILTMLQQNQHDKYLLRVYSVEIFLMMDSGPVRNMQTILSNKSEKQFISLAFIIRLHHGARSSECQMLIGNMFEYVVFEDCKKEANHQTRSNADLKNYSMRRTPKNDICVCYKLFVPIQNGGGNIS